MTDMKVKPKKRRGEIRQDFYGTWFIILKEGHDERFVGRLLPEEFERVMEGEKRQCERTRGLIYKRGKKIWLERDVDKELDINQVWTLSVNPFILN